MQLQHSTWQEVEAYLTRSTGVIIPIGSTEQHGPNGLLGTDAICPETVARGVGEQTGALVAPTIAIGMAQHHLGFAGSISLRPSTLLAVVRDVCQSLVRHGFQYLYFLNGHGGNVATVTTAFSEVWAETSFFPDEGNASAPRLRLVNWWQGDGVKRLSSELFAGAEGSHATPSEVSLSWYAHPHAVKDVPMSPRVAPAGVIRDAGDYRGRFPDGRIGSDPSLANIEAGERLYHAAVADVSSDYLRFLAAG